MATKTVTVSRPPAHGASHATSAPAAASGVDYSLTDLDILDAPDAAGTEQPASSAETPAASASDTQGQGIDARAGNAGDAAAQAPSEFDPAFALPGIGDKLREICTRDAAYRAVFSDVIAARNAAAAQTQLANLDRLVESRDPRAHAELLAGLQRSAPEAFRALALTFAERLGTLDPVAFQLVAAHLASATAAAPSAAAAADSQPLAPAASETAANHFLASVNADVESSVRESVAGRVDELLPEAPEGARKKIAGEIFRELDRSLRQDPELREHVRESIHNALRALPGTSNLSQREALARLISSRARAAMPAVAKRVVADWTETVLRSTNSRRARQSESASRVEVGRGGAPAPVSLRPRSVDYARMSDEEILDMD